MATLTNLDNPAPSSREQQCMADIDPQTGYITNIDDIRAAEYPQLKDTTYLDHAGTTLYTKTLIENYSREMTSNLFGNPHSASGSSQLSSRRIDDARLSVLRFFNADPDEFDVVFVANATAAIKMVGYAFRDHEAGFSYFYHSEAHTSLVGVRELATRGTTCFSSDSEVEAWIDGLEGGGDPADKLSPVLFAYPAQSNMTGRRLPLDWTQRTRSHRESSGQALYTLLDAAALVSTCPLDLSEPSTCPDFTALSFYKIFGFPDLGALIVRKSSGDILRRRKYFGGGTVDSVATFGKDTWHAKKSALHSALEDGTVAFHSIVALQSALDVHKKIYGSMAKISRHANHLASMLREQLRELRHANGSQVCTIYTESAAESSSQGPVIAFNLKDSRGKYISISEVEKLGVVKDIQFRTGGLCNPGGIGSHLGLSSEELRRNYDAGQRCGGENDIIHGKPTGAIRLSFGAMSSVKDVATFLDFIKGFYIDLHVPPQALQQARVQQYNHPTWEGFVVESLLVFPIKSCAAYKIPSNVAWEVGGKGLAWDREWCLVHEGTDVALSQKRFPRMALIRPEIDLQARLLRVSFAQGDTGDQRKLEISLDSAPTCTGLVKPCEASISKPANVCGEDVEVQVYTSADVSDFFTKALEVPCTLARFPIGGTVRRANVRVPGQHGGKQATEIGKSIALSNESPILLVSRSSVNRLNEQIKQSGSGGGGKAVTADSFRGNIIIAQELQGGQMESPYVEDDWEGLRIGEDPNNVFEVLGPCQRCQMVCVDQSNAQRRQEPFTTLAKTRRREGRVWFGMHMCLRSGEDLDPTRDSPCFQRASVKVGDRITPLVRMD
ncbi:selenocysteine lyase [Cladophialophora yegresii CBS 114405]|uniref:Molybdenum cofactor sulfurase n=1 Tax=Cladophialophora yegresii CBS 114405 TaxID=1182544 RepID=W9WL14_9EURO|nr:selenocysteine lyase [Cladophialophora yegresii CBS 114405]EXJ65316.1 selenocysteine lyase [Cladophialophora yegresii CBS 114405]